MSGTVNKVTLIGYLGRDPDTRAMTSGDTATNIALATTDTWKDKATGEKREQTEWHRVAFYGKLAEIADKYLRKGSLVYIEGSLRTRKYTDKDGVEKYVVEIRADDMRMLGARNTGGQQGGDDSYGQQEDSQQYSTQLQRPAQGTQQRSQQQRTAPAPQQRPAPNTNRAPAPRQAPQQEPALAGGYTSDDPDGDIPF
ncbi:single-stranded DNA-binding protein [Noviherbaspirillum pedocola]|uniref:Single-stranded DNA-binding protein n=1 Tax=Noviherbaspirillum pedocola TaxID=2801341 RepID=A0A934SV61_9BURK|nr:single-stranded DNA-binding protein [Noviherbaspirillum pedocola]MBK4736010.1 single-stranded DNA-binding protein [Noviherbaspirillum pedocola]